MKGIYHMTTYFITVQVRPLPENPLIEKIEEARVYFWIIDDSPEKAMERASEYLVKISLETEFSRNRARGGDCR